MKYIIGLFIIISTIQSSPEDIMFCTPIHIEKDIDCFTYGVIYSNLAKN